MGTRAGVLVGNVVVLVGFATAVLVGSACVGTFIGVARTAVAFDLVGEGAGVPGTGLPSPGHPPSGAGIISPCARCAGSALSSTFI